jgi:small-conductance mechanosensitive channel
MVQEGPPNGTGPNGTRSANATAPPAGSRTPNPGEQATQEVNQFLPSWLPQIPEWLVQLGLSVLIILAAWYVSQYLNRMLGRRVARRFNRPSVSRTVLRLVRLAVFAFAFLTILGIYGVSLGNIALSVTVFSAVIGVVLAPIVGSVISGLFILADQPYEVGDMIGLVDRDTIGFVEDITIRYTKIFTLDNTFLVVPNGSMRERDVMNYSAEDPRTRLQLDVQVTYEGDVKAARDLMEEAARECGNVIEGGPDIRIGSARYPAAPTCYIESFADHGILLRLRYWVREPYKLLTMRSNVQEKVWDRLSDADVEIAYPHSHVVFDDTSGQLSVAMDGRADGSPVPDAARRGASPAPGGSGVDRVVEPGPATDGRESSGVTSPPPTGPSDRDDE